MRDVLMLGANTHARVDTVHICENVHPLYVGGARRWLQKSDHLQLTDKYTTDELMPDP